VKHGKPPAKPSLEYRWKGTVDLDAAHREVADVLEVWREVSRWPDSPPFTGGVFDAWPRRLTRGISLLRSESQAVVSYLTHLEG
jgi:hypothetical protein